jgi:hypothetical protein
VSKLVTTVNSRHFGVIIGRIWSIGSSYWIEYLFYSSILQNMAQTSELLKAIKETYDNFIFLFFWKVAYSRYEAPCEMFIRHRHSFNLYRLLPVQFVIYRRLWLHCIRYTDNAKGIVNLDTTAAPKAKENSLIICFFVWCFMQDIGIGELYFRRRPVHLLNCAEVSCSNTRLCSFCSQNNGVRGNISLLQSLIPKTHAFNGLLVSVAHKLGA